MTQVWRDLGPAGARGRVRGRVQARELPLDHPLAPIGGESLGVVLHTDLMGDILVAELGGTGATDRLRGVRRSASAVAEPLTGRPARGDACGAAVRPPAAPVASLAAPSPPTPPPDARDGLRLFDAKAVFLAALVLIVGAALGAVGFTAERHYSSGLPEAVRDGGGWHVVDAHGRRFSGLSLGGPYLSWQDGPLILLVDLRSGHVRLLGPGPDHSSTWQPAVSSRYIAWFEGQSGNADRGQVYAFDLSSGRRRALTSVLKPASYVAVSGKLAVWTQVGGSDGQARMQVLDMTNGRCVSLALAAGEPIIDGELVALKRSGSSGDSLAVFDLATKRERPVVDGNGGAMAGFGLSGRRLAWGWTDASTGAARVLVRDVDSGATALVATCLGLVGPAISDDMVVWARRAESGGGSEIMGRRLGRGPAFRIAACSGQVEAVQVSGARVAWLVRDTGSRTVIQTADLPL